MARGAVVLAAEAAVGLVAVADLVVEGHPVAGDLMMSKIPSWLNQSLSEQDLQKINSLVTQQEQGTLGEIVPVIVRRSSAVGHVPVLLSAQLMIVAIICEMIWLNDLSLWDRSEMNILLVLLIAGLSFYLSKWACVQRWLTPNVDEVAQVWQRAELEFYRSQLNKTDRRSAVLILISVMERRAVILADEGLTSKVPNEVWTEVVADMSALLSKGQWYSAFEKSILRCGELLKTHAPENSGVPRNELANFLRIKE